jgi:hypothetical protein
MSALTLGPLLFNWKPGQRRDFYARIADEAPVDCVYLGEVVCSKREPLFVADLPAIAERLAAAGKQVVYSTLALVTTDREMDEIRARCGDKTMIEANDVASVSLLAGAPFVCGPFINTFNEATIDFLVARGAVRIGLPVELSAVAIATLARHNPVETSRCWPSTAPRPCRTATRRRSRISRRCRRPGSAISGCRRRRPTWSRWRTCSAPRSTAASPRPRRRPNWAR